MPTKRFAQRPKPSFFKVTARPRERAGAGAPGVGPFGYRKTLLKHEGGRRSLFWFPGVPGNLVEDVAESIWTFYLQL